MLEHSANIYFVVIYKLDRKIDKRTPLLRGQVTLSPLIFYRLHDTKHLSENGHLRTHAGVLELHTTHTLKANIHYAAFHAIINCMISCIVYVGL